MMKYLEDMQMYNNSMLQDDKKKNVGEDGPTTIDNLDESIINEFGILNPDEKTKNKAPVDKELTGEEALKNTQSMTYLQRL